MRLPPRDRSASESPVVNSPCAAMVYLRARRGESRIELEEEELESGAEEWEKGEVLAREVGGEWVDCFPHVCERTGG